MKIEVDKEYLESIERDLRQLKFAAEVVLMHSKAGGNGGYYSQFGPLTYSTMLRITGFDPKNRKICTFYSKKRDG
jgi:hypothetical protein